MSAQKQHVRMFNVSTCLQAGHWYVANNPRKRRRDCIAMSYGGTSVVADYGGVALRRKC